MKLNLDMGDPRKTNRINDVEKAHMMAHASTRSRSEASELRSEGGSVTVAMLYDKLAEILENQAGDRHDNRKKALNKLNVDELKERLLMAKALKDLLVKSEHDLIARQEQGDRVAEGLRKKVMEDYLNVVDVIDLITKRLSA